MTSGGLSGKFRRIAAIFNARTKEFYRDKSSLGWNLIFPFFIVIGFSFIFKPNTALYKAGVVESGTGAPSSGLVAELERIHHLERVHFSDRAQAIDSLRHHKVDILVDPVSREYWINESSPKGYVAEQLLLAQAADPSKLGATKREVDGQQITYLEWVFPGVLGMNLMFSGLFGVGYVVVRYRKNGVLKRLRATPLTAFEFLAAQIASRLCILIVITGIVFIGSWILFRFPIRGSIPALLAVFLLGMTSMISLGLMVASRSASEEFAGGVLNMLSWPMMILSEVWFSLEGADRWIVWVSNIFPLTHLVRGARQVMNDGAGFAEIWPHLAVLALITTVAMTIGARLFQWQKA